MGYIFERRKKSVGRLFRKRDESNRIESLLFLSFFVVGFLDCWHWSDCEMSGSDSIHAYVSQSTRMQSSLQSPPSPKAGHRLSLRKPIAKEWIIQTSRRRIHSFIHSYRKLSTFVLQEAGATNSIVPLREGLMRQSEKESVVRLTHRIPSLSRSWWYSSIVCYCYCYCGEKSRLVVVMIIFFEWSIDLLWMEWLGGNPQEQYW